MGSTPGGLPYTASTIATGPPAPADAASIDAPENTAENRRPLICRAPKASAPYSHAISAESPKFARLPVAVHGADLVDLYPRTVTNKHTRSCYNSKLAIFRRSCRWACPERIRRSLPRQLVRGPNVGFSGARYRENSAVSYDCNTYCLLPWVGVGAKGGLRLRSQARGRLPRTAPHILAVWVFPAAFSARTTSGHRADRPWR